MSADGPAFVFRLNDDGEGPDLVRDVLLERGWLPFDEDIHEKHHWNFWWKTSRFRNCDYEVVHPYQRLNHYPRATAITKKDSLARNLKRMRGVYGPGVYNFSPVAFNLPNDYTRFVAEYSKLKEKGEKPYWICKPADLSRGRGIFVFQDLSELQYDCIAVVQRYIDNPLLIAGYKFDLRIYVAVPSFHPLKIYVYREGLVRFSTEKYDLGCLDNLFAHLTNTSIQKNSPGYSVDKETVGAGCKWTLSQLRHYFHQANIDDSLLWQRIIQIMVLTLLMQAHQAHKIDYCFELYGFDVMIDEQLKPWLLEVNFSPALSNNCANDLLVKKPMLYDLIDLMGFDEADKIPGYYSMSSQQGRLPYISPPGPNSVLQMGLPLDDDLPATENGEEEEQAVVPVIPGCGLPSVQSWRPARLTTGRCSVSSQHSHGSSMDSPEQSPAGHRQQGRRHAAARSMLHFNGNQQLDGGSLSARMAEQIHGFTVQYKTHAQNGVAHKASVNSDSGVSMSSSFSDACSDRSDVGPRLACPSGSYRSSARAEASLRSAARNSSVGRIAVELSKEGFQLSSQAGKLGSISLNSSHKYGLGSSHASIPANPLVGKSLSLSRRRSVPSSGLSTGHRDLGASSTRLDYARPWRTRQQDAVDTVARKSERPVFLPNAGDFMLVFPFNAALRKCVQGKLDDRVVIRECQRLLKKRSSNKTAGSASPDKESACQPVADIPLPWGPVNKTEEIYTQS